MRRYLARPYGQTISPSRVMSLLMALALLAVLYNRFKEPVTWAWMTNETLSAEDAIATESPKSDNPPQSPDGKSASAKKPVAKETIVAGPNETDADELLELRKSLKVITDKRPLEPYEMPAYWRLMSWSRTRPLADFEKTAQRNVAFAQLWEQPDLYRGHAIRLRLHVRRVLKYEAPKNDLGLKEVYEVWGTTDDSVSFPFVVVLPEYPAGLKVGPDVEAEIVFVGYFLKWMSYRAFDKTKNAPLLIGRVRPAAGVNSAKKTANGWESAFLTLAGASLGIGALAWFGLSTWRRPRSGKSVSGVTSVTPSDPVFLSEAELAPATFPTVAELANAPHIAEETAPAATT